MIVEQVRDAVRRGGLLGGNEDLPTRPLVAMLSGGRDSVCLLDVAVALRAAGSVRALHVNYGLRGAESDADERYCAALCEQLGVRAGGRAREQGAGRGGQPAGMGAGRALHGGDRLAERETRRARRGRAHGERPGRDDPLPAGGLAGAPRAAGDEGRGGATGAPIARRHTRADGAYCEARGLQWREDESNDSGAYARVRVRHGLGAALREVHPAAEANVLRTAELLREETELLDGLVDGHAGRESEHRARAAGRAGAGAGAIGRGETRGARGGHVRAPGGRSRGGDPGAGQARRHGGGGRVDLHVGGNVSARIEDGVLSMVRLPPR